MQPRLMRSRTEVVMGGVCGGLGEYFGVDPVIVRLVFVLVTLTTGLGLLIYPVLWIITPKAPAGTVSRFRQPGAQGQHQLGTREEQLEASQQSSYVMQESARGKASQVSSRTAGPPYAEGYSFDPQTGQPMNPDDPATGQTVQLSHDPTQQDQLYQQGTVSPDSARKRWRWFAFALIGFGALVLAETLNIDVEFVLPVVMIGIGAWLLLRR
ncbi:MAG: PspC domain-containing protein [Chloroflexota bacterium]